MKYSSIKLIVLISLFACFSINLGGAMEEGVSKIASAQRSVRGIEEVSKRVKELLKKYKPEEILVIADVDGTLTIDRQPVEVGEITREKGRSTDFIKYLLRNRILLTVSSAWNDFERTLKTIEDLGLTNALKVDGISRKETENYIHISSGLVASARILIANTDPFYRNKAMAPMGIYGDKAREKIKAIIFCDDSEQNHSIFKQDIEQLSDILYPNLESVDYVLVSSTINVRLSSVFDGFAAPFNGSATILLPDGQEFPISRKDIAGGSRISINENYIYFPSKKPQTFKYSFRDNTNELKFSGTCEDGEDIPLYLEKNQLVAVKLVFDKFNVKEVADNKNSYQLRCRVKALVNSLYDFDDEEVTRAESTMKVKNPKVEKPKVRQSSKPRQNVNNPIPITGKENLPTSKEIDTEFQAFIGNYINNKYGFSGDNLYSKVPPCMPDINKYLTVHHYDKERFLRAIKNPSDPVSKYITMNNCYAERGNWLSFATTNEIYAQTPTGFGWKLHVSAMPDSALKIFKLVLENMDGLPEQKNIKVQYKILDSIPGLRTIWFLNRFITSGETQVGKFITIYPDSIEHAISLAKKLDNVFNEEIAAGNLTKDDFMPLVGDAQVGTSGGVFTRFGMYIDRDPMDYRLAMYQLDPSGNPTPGRNNKKYKVIHENKFRPWPDFMNKGDSEWNGNVNPWINQPNPFGDLPLSWRAPNGDIIHWENRPNKWDDVEVKEKDNKGEKELPPKATIAAKSPRAKSVVPNNSHLDRYEKKVANKAQKLPLNKRNVN